MLFYKKTGEEVIFPMYNKCMFHEQIEAMLNYIRIHPDEFFEINLENGPGILESFAMQERGEKTPIETRIEEMLKEN